MRFSSICGRLPIARTPRPRVGRPFDGRAGGPSGRRPATVFAWRANRAAALVVATTTGLAAAVSGAPASTARQVDPAPIRLLHSDAARIVVALDTPRYSLVERPAGGPGAVAIQAPRLAASSEPGRPQVPVAAALLGIPPHGTPRVAVTPLGEPASIDRVRIAPAPSPNGDAVEAVWADPGARGRPDPSPPTVMRRDARAYAAGAAYPAELATITDVGWIRGQRVARIEIRPFQYHARTERLVVWPRLEVEVSMDAPDGAGAPPAARAPAVGGPPDAFDAIIDASLLNAASARAWRVDRPREVLPPAEPPTVPADVQPVWNIAVAEEGLYRVTGADLALAGLPIDAIDPRRLQLYAGGQPVAMHVEGEGDALLNASDAVVFFGRPTASRYAALNVYQLAYGAVPGLRMPRRDGAPGLAPAAEAYTATLHLEQDQLYRSDYPRPALDGTPPEPVDHFFWQQLSAPQSLAHTVALTGVAPGAWAGRLSLALVGKSAFPTQAPDHRVRVHVAGRQVGEADWDGNTSVARVAFDVPADLLRGPTTEIRVEAPGMPGAAYDHFFVDTIDLAYRRVFRAAGSGQLAFVTDAAPEQGIAVDGLGEAAVDLVDVGDPRRPAWVDGADVVEAGAAYRMRFRDLPGGGRPYRIVLRGGYLRAARIEARPAAGLLAPARGADYLMIAPAAFHAALKPLVDHHVRAGRRVAVVDVQGVYDVFNGGVASAEAIRAFVAHAFAAWPEPAPSHVLLVGDGTYDPRNRLGTGPATLIPPFLKEADPWLGEVAVENAFVTVSGDDVFPDLFLGRLPANSAAEVTAMVSKIVAYGATADVEPWQRKLLFATDDPDSAGDFYALSDDVIDHHVPPGYTVDRVYLKRTHADAAAAGEALRAGFMDGYLLAQYVGHGLITGWAQEQMWTGRDVRVLKNGRRLPVLLDMTCMTGFFSDPRLFSISESAVRTAGGGAIAAFSPTGFGVATGHDHMNRAFADQLLGGGVRHLGQVVVGSKLALSTASTGYRDLIETYALFGDPALDVRVPFTAPTATADPGSTEPPPPSPTAEPVEPTATGAPTATADPGSTEPPPPSPTAEPAEPTATGEPPAPTATGAPPESTPTPTTDVKSTPPSHANTATPWPPTATATQTARPSPTATAMPSPSAPPRVTKRYLPLALAHRRSARR